MKVNPNDRLSQFFEEAVKQPVGVMDFYQKAMTVTGRLIDNVAARIEWTERRNREARSKGKSPAPHSMVGELETLAKIVATLHDGKMDAYRTDDPDAGARAICRILELARQDFKNSEPNCQKVGEENATCKPTDGADVKKALTADKTGEEGEGGEPDKTRQNPTEELQGTYKPTTDFHRRAIVRTNRG